MSHALMERQIKLIQEGNESLRDKEVTINVTVHIPRKEGNIDETVAVSSNKYATLSDLSLLSVKEFNKTFKAKEILIKFNEDSLGYKLLPLGGENSNEIPKNTKSSNLDTTDFVLEYNPQDILLNFHPKRCCCFCNVL